MHTLRPPLASREVSAAHCKRAHALSTATGPLFHALLAAYQAACANMDEPPFDDHCALLGCSVGVDMGDVDWQFNTNIDAQVYNRLAQ